MTSMTPHVSSMVFLPALITYHIKNDPPGLKYDKSSATGKS